MKRLGPRVEQRVAQTTLWVMTLVTIGVLLFIIFFVLRRGLPVLSLRVPDDQSHRHG